MAEDPDVQEAQLRVWTTGREGEKWMKQNVWCALREKGWEQTDLHVRGGQGH